MKVRRFLLGTAAILPGIIAASPLAAQSYTLDSPPVRLPLDENGVDLASGKIVMPSSSVTIGGADGLSHSRFRVGNGWRHNYMMSINVTTSTATVTLGGGSQTFTKTNGLWVSDQGDGSSLTSSSSAYVLTASDGTQITFDRGIVAGGASYYGSVSGVATRIVRPGGHTTTLHYRLDSYWISSWPEPIDISVVRLESVNTNTGYQLKYSYAGSIPSSSDSADPWYQITRVTAINSAVEYCDPMAYSCSLSNPWPFMAYNQTVTGSETLETATDILDRQARYRTDANKRLIGIRRPREGSSGDEDDIRVNYDGNSRVSSIVRQNQYTRTYTWTPSSTQLTSVSNDALGRKRTVIADTSKNVIVSDTNALNQRTSYGYDGKGRVISITAPEGQVTAIQYDGRGNTKKVERRPRPGAGGRTIVTTAEFPTTCGNIVTCNKPSRTTGPTWAGDPVTRIIDYVYDPNHGGVTSITAPTDLSSTRPRSKIAYVGYTAKVRNASGTLVAASGAIQKPQTLRVCRTASECAGSGSELVTELAYDTAIAPNLDVTMVTARAGDGTLVRSTRMTYTKLGDVATVNGPIPAPYDNDIMTYRYDDAGQVTGTISPDPDGSGGNPRLATKIIYNADGQVTKTQSGTVTGTSEAAWNAFAATQEFTTQYDAFGGRWFSVRCSQAPPICLG